MTTQRHPATAPVPANKTTDAASASRQIDALIARLDDWRGAQLAEVRALIRAADPQVEEQWKWMGTPTLAHDGIYAIANPHNGKVKITFGHGPSCPIRTGCSTRARAARSGGPSICSRATA